VGGLLFATTWRVSGSLPRSGHVCHEPGRDGDMRAIRFAVTGRRVQEASLARLLERQILA
jgi:hypothetical protein